MKERDSVFSPMAIKRQPPFSSKPEYEHLKEEPREIYLSSAFYKSHWMWGLIKEAIIGAYENKSICVSMDYAVSVKHNIRSTAYMEKEKKKMSPIVFDMEYNNLMAGGAENQYYSFELTSQAQKIKKAWYPMPLEDYINKKKTWFGDIKKQDGEIRIVSIDIAMMSTVKGKSANDLSVIKCIRALPNGNKYERQEVYTRTMEGVDIEQQAIKVRRIMYDFKADYIVFDGRTYGINFTDAMAKTLYDEERDIEYPPIKVMNNKDLADRCKNDLAMPIMWAFMGTSENNHKMHTAMLSALMDKKYKMLISQVNCKEEYLLDKKEYQLGNLDQKALYELPYVLSDLTVNEMINLSKEFVQGSYIKLIEPRNGLKDKYVTSAMANLFVQDELEIKLTEKAKDTRGYYSVLRKFRQPKVYK